MRKREGSRRTRLFHGDFVFLLSHRTAYVLAQYRPRCPIIAVTRDPQTARLVSNRIQE